MNREALKNIKPVKVIDVRGELCPVPTLRTSEALNNMKPGETLLILTDDDAALEDISSLAKRTGNKYLGSVTDKGFYKVYVEVR